MSEVTDLKLTDMQTEALRILSERHGPSTNAVGYLLRRRGHLKRSSGTRGNYVLGAASVLRALDRRGLVKESLSDQSEWAVKIWYLTTAGRDLLARIGSRPTTA